MGGKMRRQEERAGLMPGEFENAGEQQEQKEEECQALALHQAGKRPSERGGRRRGTGGG